MAKTPKEIVNEIRAKNPELVEQLGKLDEQLGKPMSGLSDRLFDSPRRAMTDFEKEALKLLKDISANLSALKQMVEDHTKRP